MNDNFDLERFMTAQANTFDIALREIRRGSKRSHWMWFVFPQIAGLGHSVTARHYAIDSRAVARAYLAHPVLGARLRLCVAALQDLAPTSAEAIFGKVDAMKLRPSLTLFAAADDDPIFAAALDRWLAGSWDPATLGLLDTP